MLRTLLCVALMIAPVAVQADPEPPMEPLFDGKSLKGWIQYAGPGAGSARWQVRDGVIVSAPGVALLTPPGRIDTTDFDLKAEVKLEKGAWGVLCVRAAAAPAVPSGYQIALNADGKERSRTGALYYNLALLQDVKRPTHSAGVWTPIRVMTWGPRIRCWVNISLVSDHTQKGPKPMVGQVGFWSYGGTIQVRKLEYLPLPPGTMRH